MSKKAWELSGDELRDAVVIGGLPAAFRLINDCLDRLALVEPVVKAASEWYYQHSSPMSEEKERLTANQALRDAYLVVADLELEESGHE